ncbi:MAG TPA: hypothetical protein VGK99_14715 [Acidobacteriota bacterium]|jgi:hypothetical protein
MDFSSTRYSSIKIGIAGILILASLYFYVPLLSRIPGRAGAIVTFWWVLLPAAVAHALLLLLITGLLRKGARAALIFWLLSAAGLIGVGGWRNVRVFLGLLAVALAFEWIGNGIVQRVMSDEWRGWGLSLAFGMGITSVVASFLMMIQLFKPWIVAGTLLLLAVVSARARVDPASYVDRVRRAWIDLESRWNLSFALSLEVAFLIVAFLYVASSAPERTSDAMRFYWPYVKLVKYHSGFFSNPFQASYIIPQGGLAYAATVFLLLGKTAVRWAMFLAWLALLAIVSRRRPDVDGAICLALAGMLATCPVVVSVTTSLMQDSFVILAIVMLGVVCVMGKSPASLIFWLTAGAAAGLAWNAKYSTATFAAPLLLVAFVRSWKAAGWKASIRGSLVALVAFVFVSIPWLWHAYRVSGNPVFPFLARLFPSALWPQGVGIGNLDTFRLPQGPRGWFLWAIDLTYQTSRFVEGYDGYLGLSLLVLLIFALPTLWNKPWRDRALIISAVCGTALLWTVTAYLRYWLAALWLMALAVQPLISRLTPNAVARMSFCALAGVIALVQIPFSMATAWFDPHGWPWDFYTGKLQEWEYIGRAYPGFHKLQARPELNLGWPRVWSTGYEATGHFKVEPMDALIWEIQLHGVRGALAQIKYLASAGSRYWVVNRSAIDAKWLTASGISNFFWDDKYLVESEGPVAVYRMKPIGELEAEFSSRLQPGSDLLLDAGFEKGDWDNLGFWRGESGGAVLISRPDAFKGGGIGRVRPGEALRQDIPLPSGLGCAELICWARSVDAGKPVSFGMQLGWGDDIGNFLGANSQEFQAGGSWQEFRIKGKIPAGATYADVYLVSKGGAAGIYVDEAHLYSRDCR